MFWSILMVVIGGLMFLGGYTKSNFFLYRMFSKKSEALMGDNVHKFYMTTGGIISVLGLLLLFNII